MIYVVATLVAKPDKHADLLAGAKICIAATQKEAGCISYDLLHSITEPNTFVFVERWETRESLTVHSKSGHLKVWRAVSNECITSRKIEIIHPDKVENVL
jgi:quinol monooxygenase YgiN